MIVIFLTTAAQVLGASRTRANPFVRRQRLERNEHFTGVANTTASVSMSTHHKVQFIELRTDHKAALLGCLPRPSARSGSGVFFFFLRAWRNTETCLRVTGVKTTCCATRGRRAWSEALSRWWRI
ncbi:hypothetical protein CTAM01_05722 [Colletotrichum tamarilloi]|uniref:Secreted protein n=1 Tax=Colletotrichum tamarilloi TaxID=1209934 RepID=A0ABQ9RD93_9PEZI|nr:uncharacterized protein CTAM01_05722 [Colletotrichum tamarilloi]KAK1501498.1 hypothetical protein CTAM01_05722 [Colletotrichum tamarilloi]